MNPDELGLKISLTTSGGAVEIPPARMIVFVGPNNSGKSLALTEIGSRLAAFPATKLVGAAELELPIDEPGMRELLDSICPFGTPQICGWTVPQLNGEPTFIHEKKLPTDAGTRLRLAHQLAPALVLKLDGEQRLRLANARGAADSRSRANNPIAVIEQQRPIREKLRRIVLEAIGRHLVIDPTRGGNRQLNLSDRAPTDEDEELSTGERGVAFHDAATPLESAGDGYRAYIGILLSVLAMPYRVILIDEPEAFLHPPLARRLGRNLAEIAKDRGAFQVVATHSAEFLMGCVESGVDLTVVRLSYDGTTAGARVLDPVALRGLMQKPLLRSANVLTGLFARGVIVTEGASDTAFYTEINHRLLAADSDGVSDGLFITAQGIDTSMTIAAPLRALGIPAATIIDLDLIGNNQNKLKAILGVDEGCCTAAAVQLCVGAKKLFEAEGVNPKEVGVEGLPVESRRQVESLLGLLAEHGIFAVPVGQLERWLLSLGVQPRKSKWVPEIFEKMGSDPAVPQYLKPESDDVWEFIRRVARWIDDPNRKGMPT